jgi:hypothetical protein
MQRVARGAPIIPDQQRQAQPQRNLDHRSNFGRAYL